MKRTRAVTRRSDRELSDIAQIGDIMGLTWTGLFHFLEKTSQDVEFHQSW